MGRYRYHLYFWEILLLLTMVGVLSVGVAAARRQASLADKVVRLHVLANSDTAEDQALKLRVRDDVLVRAEALMGEASDREEAVAALSGALEELQEAAARRIAEEGYSYPVRAELTETEFPTRSYGSFALPAGRYLALRILIGEAEGENWWCVVFPPLCTAVSTDVPAMAAEAGFSEEDVQLICGEEEYVLRFKLVELWERLRQTLSGAL